MSLGPCRFTLPVLGILSALLLLGGAPPARAQASNVDTSAAVWSMQYPPIDFTMPQRLYAVNNHTVVILSNGFLLRSTDEGATWERRDLPGCFDANGATFYGDSLVWLVGNSGSLYKSTDGGSTWVYHRLYLSSVDLRFVSFVSPTVGWMGGSYGMVLHTTDGGDTWSFQDYWQTFDIQGLSFVHGLNDSVAWLLHMSIVTNFCRNNELPAVYRIDLVRTTDGGMTWGTLTHRWNYLVWPNILGPSMHINRQECRYGPDATEVDVNNVVTASATQARYFGPETLGGMVTDSDLTAWNHLWTTDGGASWDSALVDRGAVVRFPKMFDFTRGWGTDVIHAYLYRSVNPDSMVWVRRTTPRGTAVMPNLYDFVDTLQGWCYVYDPVGGTVTIYETTDGALTWQAKSTAPLDFGSLRDVCFLGADTGWAVGATPTGGVVLQTDDRGRSWSILTATIPDSLRQVQFVNTHTGWALGTTLHVTHDGGRTWAIETGAPLDTLRPWVHYIKVQFVDSLTGWLARSDWFTLRTTDGGATWQQAHPQDTAAQLTVARAVDGQTLMEVGTLGTETYVFRLLQGGHDFQDYPLEATVPSGTNPPTRPAAIYFLDSLHGWLLDDTPNLFASADAGLTWRFVSSTTDFRVPGPFVFTDTSNGWLLKQGYYLYDPFSHGDILLDPAAVVRLSQGGTMTTPQSCVGHPQHGLAFVGDSLGWTVGDNLTVYHYYLPASARIHTAPFMTLSPPALDYGIVKPSTVKRDTIRIFNTGNDTLRIYRVQTRDRVFKAFHVASMVPPLLRPGDSTICAIDFVPPMYHTFYDTLFVYSNDDTQAVLLRGVGDVVQDVSESELAALHDEVLVPYPNPFAHETTIRLAGAQVPERVGVYDAYGREVADLTAQARAGGPMRFRADAVAPGLYLCVARLSGRTATQRLIVVR